MLSQLYSKARVRDVLIPRADWRPFPTASRRDAWEALPERVRQAQIARGEDRLNFDWPPVPATRFLDYARNGNRSRYEALSFGRRTALADLVLAECAEGEGRFLDEITNGVWCICEESFWGVPAHIGVQQAGSGLPDTAEPIVDLFAAETSELLAWTAYLLGPQLDSVSPLIVPRIAREIQARILTPLLEREDFGWMGYSGARVNNWNPWIASNWLSSNLLMETDEARRVSAVFKAMETVDHFIDPYPKDGGCDEGPGYWGRAGAALYDCLEWLHSATRGAIDVYDEPLIQNIGKFIYRVQIADQYFINFADASPVVMPSFAVVYGYGKRVGDESMMALGAWAARQQGAAEKGITEAFGSMGRALPALFSLDEILRAKAATPLPRDVFLDEIEVFVARDRAGSSDGFFVGAKGGHNAESHNHNDIGQVVVYVDGKPVIVDAGVETYTAKTFSSERYEIWTMQSQYHTLPTVNGHMQLPGRVYSDAGIDYHYDIAARDVSHGANDATATMTLDIAQAYPPEAQIDSWVRTVTLERGEGVTITDQYALKAITGDLVMHVLTACTVEDRGNGTLALNQAELAGGRVSGTAHLHCDADVFDIAIETIPIKDPRLNAIWGDVLRRIVLTVKNPEPRGAWTIRIAD